MNIKSDKKHDFSEAELKGNFSNRLNHLMERDGLTQSKVADKANVSRQNLAKYCSGKALPNSYTLYSLANTLNVSCDYLLGIDDGKSVGNEYIMQRTGLNDKSISVLEECNSDGEFKIATFAINSFICRAQENDFFTALGKYISSPELDKEDLDDIYGMILPHVIGTYAPHIGVINNEDEVWYENIKLDDIVYHQMIREFNEIIHSLKKDSKTKEILIKHIIKILKPYYKKELRSLIKYELEYGEKVLFEMNVDKKILSKVMVDYLDKRRKEADKLAQENIKLRESLNAVTEETPIDNDTQSKEE